MQVVLVQIARHEFATQILAHVVHDTLAIIQTVTNTKGYVEHVERYGMFAVDECQQLVALPEFQRRMQTRQYAFGIVLA